MKSSYPDLENLPNRNKIKLRTDGIRKCADPGTSSEEGSGTTYPSYGNVVYHIGDNSAEALKAGAKFTGTAKTSGMLYISIYETVYNAANTGSYTVRIHK